MQKIKLNLPTKIIGQQIYFFKEIDSTNNKAIELATKEVSEGTIVLAKKQTSGKGRFKRKWFSPSGGIYLSIILFPYINVKYSWHFTFISALSVAKTIQKLYNLPVKIKWPNDIIINNKKVSGILTEIEQKNNFIKFAIIGIGINLQKIPDEQEKITSIEEETNKKISYWQTLKKLFIEYENNYFNFQKNGFVSILNEVKYLSYDLNRFVRINYNKEIIEGYAIDIEENGGLVIRTESGFIKVIKSGEII
ncbi:MAG: biotin--[acetyl-CoA-carboxylase] ligase [bacterium]